MTARRIGAWALNVPSEKILEALLGVFKGTLGAVIGPHQVGWAIQQRAFAILDRPHDWTQLPSDALAILGSDDEPNKRTPAGAWRVQPPAIEADVKELRRAFPNTPVAPGGLANVGGWWEQAAQRTGLDRQYFAHIAGFIPGPYTLNMGATRLSIVKEALRAAKGPWIICGIPQRPAWRPQFTLISYLIERLVGPSIEEWVKLGERPDVLAVTFWVLLQDGDQTDYGIFAPVGDGRYRLTTVGKRLYRALVGPGAYPEVRA